MKTFKLILGMCLSLVLIAIISSSFHKHYLDVTSHHSHGLTSTTQSVLKSLEAPLSITLVTQNDDLKRDVTFFIDRLSQDFEVIFKHEPVNLTPELSDRYGFANDGLIFEYQDQAKGLDLSVHALDELTFTKTLFKLIRHQTQWIVFVEGHGEPNIYDDSARGYAIFSQALMQQGLKVQSLNLTQTGFIPDNTSLLVLTSPKAAYLPKEEKAIEAYLKQGGALLWLMDYQGKPLPFLSHLLGVHAHEGVIMDQHGTNMGTPHPAITIITDYKAAKAIGSEQLTAYPWAQALKSEPRAAFKKTKILQTSNLSWTHKGPIEGELRFNPDSGDLKGPLDLGYLLQRPVQDEKTQQIIVIGNHRFASNGTIRNYGNLSMSLGLVNHLLDESALIHIDYAPPKDIIPSYPQAYHYFLNYGLMLLLPGLLLLLGSWFRAPKKI